MSSEARTIGLKLGALVRLRAVRVDDLAVFPGHEDPPTPPVSAPLRRHSLVAPATPVRDEAERFLAAVHADLDADGLFDRPPGDVKLLEVVPPTCTTFDDELVQYEWQFGVYVEGECV